MQRLEQINITIENLKAQRAKLEQELTAISEQRGRVINDVSQPKRDDMEAQLSRLDAEAQKFKLELQQTDAQIETWQRRQAAIIQRRQKESRQETRDAWNQRQRRIYDLCVEYNELITRANSTRDEMVKLMLLPDPEAGDAFFYERDSTGALQWRSDLLPRALLKLPQPLSKVEINEADEFEPW